MKRALLPKRACWTTRALLLPWLAVLAGCMPVSSASSVPGSYAYASDKSKATLLLRADGTFLEMYTAAAGTAQPCVGHWRWNAQEHVVEFPDGFISPAYVDRGMLQPLCRGTARLPAMNSLKGTYLEENPDDSSQNFRRVAGTP